MNFLVTGGAGFIGSNLCDRLLREGHEVWVFDDLNDFYSPARKERNIREFLSSPQFHFVKGDLRDRRAIDDLFASAQFDQVVHLGARAGTWPSLKDPALYQEVNVLGTTYILEACRARKIKKITIASSSSVYGANTKLPFSETDPIRQPISPYACSKLACEALGHVYHHIHGMDVIMLRFFTVYGPRQRPDLAIYKFAGLIQQGKPIPVFGDGSTARDYTFVTDTLDGIMAATRTECGFEIFNLGESVAVPMSRLIELLEQSLGKKALIERLPLPAGDVPLTCADISKAERLLGYHPRVKIEEGIRRFIDWFRAEAAV